ncbi:DUF4376 domain-containing protein [Chitinibacteraceae bacterium HSL-7]
MQMIYPYHPSTGREGTPQRAEIDPLDGRAVLLAYTTFAAPPVTASRESAVYIDADGRVPLDPGLGSWSVVADWVGYRYWLADGSAHEITELGVTPPADALEAAPPAPLQTLIDRAMAQLPGWESTQRAAGIQHAGHGWVTTPAALQDIRDALLAGVVPGSVWFTAARVAVPMSLADLQALWAACVTRAGEIYARRMELETQLETMTREQLEAFTPGWPA